MRSPNSRFAATLRCGNNANSWNIIPIPRRCEGTPSITSPSNETVPASARSSPASTRKIEVLPQPLGPNKARISPSSTSKETPSRTRVPS